MWGWPVNGTLAGGPVKRALFLCLCPLDGYRPSASLAKPHDVAGNSYRLGNADRMRPGRKCWNLPQH